MDHLEGESPKGSQTVGPRLRRAVAAHPVTATLLMMFIVAWGLLFPAAFAGLPLAPFLLGAVLLGQLLPAVLVSAAVGGRPAVRDLFARVFRWRVAPIWYAVVLLAIPAASLALAALLFGTAGLHALVTDPTVVLAYLTALSILPVVNLWEETAWMGMVQGPLTARHGLLVAGLVTGPLFSLIHLPLRVGEPVGALLLGVLAQMAVSVPFRIMLGWVYDRTGHSILLVAAMHATFNATNNGTLITAADPAHAGVLALVPWLVTTIWGLAVATVTLTRRRGARRTPPTGTGLPLTKRWRRGAAT
jgi:membrane protease YdiL (CAAX protease family)